MEQHNNEGAPAAPVFDARRAPQGPPAMAGPQAAPPAGSAPGFPAKKKWWSVPKVMVAAGIAVLLAGGGGGVIGYSVGKSDATRQAAQRFQNGRPNGANGQPRRDPGPGQIQPTAPATPGAGTP